VPIDNGICVHVISDTSELALYFTAYSDIIHNGGRVYGIDKGYKGGNLTSRVIRRLGDRT